MSVDEFKNHRFQSFDGKSLSLYEMSHQHISNLHYFLKYFKKHPLSQNPNHAKALQEIIEKRFNNIILPYRPHPKLGAEIQILRWMDMIIPKGNQLVIIDPITKKEIGEMVDGEFFD